ncbi:unnamed protein product [Microthlaspi erraticum]|uniref:Uncharacterized protein n=1 Tax=Microthlaspi erraticum TaxID=1685480 RepID=A0A6D2IMW1_9BRAS|nr:unnamed protein product [Microthlaspi erraticum]
MQQNSFFLGCNYSNRDMRDNARSGWSLCPVQDIGNVNVNVDETYSLLYYDLYLRQLKETLKHTMLVHESVFESQIHELHRLYRRQKELMMEMGGARHHEALNLNSSFLSLGTTHWMSSSVSTYQTRNEENIPNHLEAVDHADKSKEKVLDLELPVLECHVRRKERGSVNGEVGEVSNFDLNEPAKIEEHSDYVLNQFLSPVTSVEIGEESGKKNEEEDCVKSSNIREFGINLNMSPLSYEEEEEVILVNKFETEKPPESVPVSLHEEHRPEQSRALVLALPCSSSSLRCKPVVRGSRSKKKAKLRPSNKTFKGSDLKDTSQSRSNEARRETLSKVKTARDQTNLGKKRRCKPQMKSTNGHKEVVKKKRKKSRRISLVTEGNYEEVSAAEAIVDMSRKSGREISDCITSLGRDLLWLAEISLLVAEDYEIDCFEDMALQLTEMKLKEDKRILRSNSADNKTAVSSIVRGRQRRNRTRQGKQKCIDNRSVGTFSESEADEDVQVIGKLIEASESKWNKRKTSATKPMVKEETSVDWGARRKRRRGSRIPAADFQHLIIN